MVLFCFCFTNSKAFTENSAISSCFASDLGFPFPSLLQLESMAIIEVFLGAFLTLLLDKMASGEWLEFLRHEGIHTQLSNWANTLSPIQALLTDAEDKQLTNRAVNLWLDDLQDLAYDLDDLVDDFFTEALRRKLMSEQPQASSSKEWNFIPTCCSNLRPSSVMFNFEMRSKNEEINTRLRNSFEQGSKLYLVKIIGTTPTPTTKTWQRPESTSLIDEPHIYGREHDQSKIIELLVRGDESSHSNVAVIPIVGMGGIGKTTLAQIFNNLDHVQVQLKQALAGKKSLIVLDNVWNNKYSDWNVLKKPFSDGAQDSKIVVTTRNRDVARMMGAVKLHDIEVLSAEDCWSLFAQHAFENRSIDANTNLVSICKKIAEKCKGLPLAAKALGGLLLCKERDEEWEDVLHSKIWDLPQESDILPALRLSYHHLPSHLKQCFAYCSIIPNDYEFEEEELVFLWMAEGFIQKQRKKQMEDVGGEYFRELLSRSFFKPSYTGKRSKFVMHDLINDLAQVVARDTCFRLDDKLKDQEQYINLKKVRHSSYMQEYYEGMKKFEIFDRAMHLQTFLPFHLQNISYYNLASNVPLNLLPKLRCLRVLNMSRYHITEVPNSVGDLKHLRYLNFSGTLIEELPESLGSLYNLQTLMLRKCQNLKKLPTDLGNLIDLRHLDTTDARALEEMPLGIGKLASLQTLSNFVVTKNNGLRIRKLGNLIYLQGKLCLPGLQNMVVPLDAREANLNDKQGLDVETLSFKDMPEWEYWYTFEDKEVQPFTHVIELSIKNCPKLLKMLPNDLPCLNNLDITGCPQFLVEVSNLVLPSLTSLVMNDVPLTSLQVVLGTRNMVDDEVMLANVKSKHPSSITSLSIGMIKKLELLPKWVTHELMELKALEITSCEELKTLWKNEARVQHSLPTFRCLKIKGCPQLVSLFEGDEDEENKGQHEQQQQQQEGLPCIVGRLEHLRIDNCEKLEKLPRLLHTFTFLQELYVFDCPSLGSFPETGFPCTLKKLEIRGCEALQSLFGWIMQINDNNLEVLEVGGCPSLTCLISCRGGGLPPTLKNLQIWGCKKLEALLVEEGMEINCPSLESIWIWGCDRLKYLPDALPNNNNLRNLSLLAVGRCENLESIPKGWFHFTTNLTILNITGCKKLKALPVLSHGFQTINYLTSLQGLLSSLIKLLIEGPISVAEDEEEDDVTGSSFPIDGKLLPTSLISLSIMKFRNLEKLSSKLFQNLASLEEFYIRGCPRLKSLPVQRLPPLLKRLSISGSRKLTGNCEMGKGKYWPHISKIPKVKVDGDGDDDDDDDDDDHHSANRSNRGSSSSASIEIHDQEEWEKYRKWAATCVAMYAPYAVSLVSILHCRDYRRKSISEQGDYERYLRMNKDAFATLVSMLKRTQFLRDNPQSELEEQVMKFLHIIGNNLRNRTIKFFYRQSGEAVSRHFHQVFKVIISLEDIFLKQLDGFNCPPEIGNNPKYWPYFKFTQILPGWDGSTSDSRILDDALSREMDKLIVPQVVEGGQECSVEIDKKHLKWNNQMDVVLIDSLLDQMLKGQKIGGSFTSSAYRAASNAVNFKRNLAMAKDMLTIDSGFRYNHSTQLIEATAGPKEKRLHWNFDGIGIQDDQIVEVSCSSNSKKRKNKSGDTLSKEIRSIKNGLDAIAAALDRGNLRNHTNGKLFEEIEKVRGMSDDSRMKVYQVLAKEVSDARAYLECPIECRGLWLSVKFGSSIFNA
ncbi:unnamed protein product [Camellia sinensis]